MIRLLVRFSKWLEVRFPEKLVVTAVAYDELHRSVDTAHVEIGILRGELRELQASHTATVDRVSRVEASAVHKGAVKDLVTIVQAQKDEIVALKANLGWSKPTVDAVAALNGELIHGE